MKKVKQFISILLSVLIVTAVMPITAFAAEATEVTPGNVNISGENEICKWSYTANDKTLFVDGEEIIGISDTISVNYKKMLPTYVTSEDGSSTYYKLIPERILFSKNVKSIHNILWANSSGTLTYPKLKTVEFENSDTVNNCIGERAFEYLHCEEFVFPDSMTEIGTRAFEEADFAKFDLNKIKVIGEYAFTLANIPELIITESVEKIMYRAFCDANIGDIKWENNDDLYLDEGVFSGAIFVRYDVQNHSFGDEYDVVIPANIAEIPAYCFDNAWMKSVSFEEKDTPNGKQGVKSIGYSAFKDLGAVPIGSLPSTLEELGGYAFYCNTAITEIDLSNTKVTEINNYTFNANSNLERVKLNENTTRIGDYAFNNNNNLVSINLPNTLTEIGNNAFYRNSKLSVKLPESLTKIGEYAFYRDTLVDGDLYLPNLKLVGGYAFYMTGITSFIMNTEALDTDDDPIWIDPRAFKDCTSLKNVVLPKHLEGICDYVFENTAIDSIVIPEDVEFISQNAFRNCKQLASVEFSGNNKLKEIGRQAFENCIALESITLPSSVTTIADYAFDGCTSLKSFGTLSKNLQSIGSYAFDDTQLTSIRIESIIAEVSPVFYTTMPEGFVIYGYNNSSVEVMCNEYDYAFVAIDGVPEIPDDPDYVAKSGSWENGNWFISGSKLTISGTGNLTKEFFAPDGKTVYTPLQLITKYNVTGIVFVGEIKSIPDEFIYDENVNYSKITSVTFTDSVEKIGAYAFYGQPITSFTAPKNLVLVGDYAFTKHAVKAFDFTKCSNLSIGDYAFANAVVNDTDLTVTMDNSVKSIGSHAFVGNRIKDLILTNVTTIGNSAFEDIRLYNLTIDGTKYIGEYAFKGAGLGSLTIPSSVCQIGKYAFSGNDSLRNLTFEDNKNLTVISEGAFENCAVESISLPTSVKRLEKRAFANNIIYRLNDISLPSSIEYIHYSEDLKECAFATYDSGSINTAVVVELDPTNTVCTEYAAKLGLEIKISSKYADASGESITGGAAHMKTSNWMYYENNNTLYVYSPDSIAGLGFKYNDGTEVKAGEIEAERIEIINGTKAIGGLTTGSMFAVFNPKYIIIPNTVTRISENAFSKCERLEGISIPDSVTQLSAHVFDGCSSLKSVKFGTGVDRVSDSLFKNIKSLQFVDLGGIKEVGMNAFKNCTNLEEIIIPDSVETVDSHAFYKCLNVKHISIGKNLANIGDYAFASLPLCDKIEINSNTFNEGRLVATDIFKGTGSSTTGINVIYGNDITTANLAYLDGVNVRKITFGSTVNGIRNLKTLSNLEEIAVDENNPHLFDYKNCLYTNANELLYVPSTLTRVDIMPAVEKICDNAFKDSQVLNINLPNGLKEIGNYAFYGCKELKRVSFAEKSTLTKIGDSAFENCSSLKSVLISKPIQVIGKKAFKNCINLTSVVLPDSLKTISQDAFVFCNSLKYVVVPEGTETIDTGSFAYCENLEEIYIFYNTNVNYNAFNRSPKVTIHTIAASPAYVFARGNKIPYTAYTDGDAFFDIAMMKLDVIAGYLGYCANGHGKTEYLTVYESTCEHDGYVIGVCEDCSEILEEIHTVASGHEYTLTVDIEPTQSTKGMKVYTCSNCDQTYCDTIPPLGGEAEITTQSVTGSVVIAMDKKAQNGVSPVKGATIVIDGYTVATTNADGKFSFELETGVYAATVHYNYGFDRQIYIVVEDHDVNCNVIPIIGCDWNKDGKIDDEDLRLFSMVASTQMDDLSYLDFVDMNGDGLINGIDLLYIRLFLNANISTFEYENIIAK